MKVLFVARRFPPSIGGMERFAFELSQALPSKDVELVKVTWGGSSRLTLLFALPWLFFKSLWKVLTDRSIDIIHMQDAVMSPLGWLLSKLGRRPWIVVAHGLDLTFSFRFYQMVNIFFARRCKAMIAISGMTAQEALKRGATSDKLSVIPLGVSDKPLAVVDSRALRATLGIDNNAPVLLTVGRLTKRKGVNWFIDQVLPQLSDQYQTHYVVIGEGTERETIIQTIRRHRLEDRVHLLGAVDDATKQSWLQSADVFVMPNIRVPGDMEGFGIVVHEAAMAELPVVASNLEGITQALQDGKNGILLAEKDVKAYVSEIESLLSNKKRRTAFGKRARQYTLKNFGWPTIADKYRAIYRQVIS